MGNMDVHDYADHPQVKPSVILTGTAKEGSAGPPIGLVDIGISEDAYLFRVALPGIRKNESTGTVYTRSGNSRQRNSETEIKCIPDESPANLPPLTMYHFF